MTDKPTPPGGHHPDHTPAHPLAHHPAHPSAHASDHDPKHPHAHPHPHGPAAKPHPKPFFKTWMPRIIAVLIVLMIAGYLIWDFWLKPIPIDPVVANAPDCTKVDKLPANYALLGLKDGCVEIVFLPKRAPNHVARVKELINKKFYDGLTFHRVIEGFMAQTGDPFGTGSGGADMPNLKAEFSLEPFVRGTLGMARSGNPNSANSQFFITTVPAPHLNGQYTVFGQVVSGMEYIDNIKKGDPARNGRVTDPDKIITFRVSPK